MTKLLTLIFLLIPLPAMADNTIYKCLKNNKTVFTSENGPGCQPLQINPPTPSAAETQRELNNWSQRQSEEQASQEQVQQEDPTARMQSEIDQLKQQVQNQRQMFMQQQSIQNQQIIPLNPNPDARTLEENPY